MKKIIIIGGGTLLGAVLLNLWWNRYGAAVSTTVVQWSWWVAGVGLAASSLGLQVLRTARLLRVASPKRLQSIVLLSHGMNVLLPSLLGDAYEVTAFAKHTQMPARAILLRLIHRFGTTVSALGLLMAGALALYTPNASFFVAAAAISLPFLTDVALPGLGRVLSVSEPRSVGAIETSIQLLLAWVQHIISAIAVFCFGVAINDAVSPAAASAMLSIADAVTYLPVPFGGVGVNHWGVTAICDLIGRIPATLIAFNHGMVVLVGGLSIAFGLATQPKAMHNR